MAMQLNCFQSKIFLIIKHPNQTLLVLKTKNLKKKRLAVKLLQSVHILKGHSTQKDFVKTVITRAGETRMLTNVLTQIALAT